MVAPYRPPGLWSRLQRGLLRLLFRLVRWAPLPAQEKWAAALQLFSIQLLVLERLGTAKLGLDEAATFVGQTLYQTGRRWLELRLFPAAPPVSGHELMRDVLGNVTKALNLPSQITATSESVAVTTFACPFLEGARRAGDDPRRVCEHVCGEGRSFFQGISDGFPFSVRYGAPQKMGHGAEVCLKELRLRPTQLRRRRPSPFWRRRSQDAEAPLQPPSLLGPGF